MRKILAVTATVALTTALGVAVATDAQAAITAPGNGATVHGTVTLTESPGGQKSANFYCSSTQSTDLYLNGTSFHVQNGGGPLSASLRTEDYPNGTYTVHGVETDRVKSGFGGLGCGTSTRDYYSTINISNQKKITYTGATSAVADTFATVSAKVVDPNDGSAPLSGQSVTFALSGGSSVTANTNSSGIATASLPVNTPPRNATISVNTPATAYFTAAADSSAFTIEHIPSSITVSPIAAVVHGQQTQFAATVGHNAGLAATGSVQFVVDGSDFGPAVGLSGDTAYSATTSTLSTGNHSVVAEYLGDGNYLPSTSDPVTQRVNQGATTTSLSSSLNPSVYGQSVTFTAGVAVVAPAVGAPSGAIQFSIDGTPYGTAVPLDGTSATLTIAALSGGNHAVSATYNGDTDLAASTSPDLTQGVDRRPTGVTVHSSAEPSITGQAVTFSVDVASDPSGIGTPTGQVQFSVDGIAIGAPVTLSNGSATSPPVDHLSTGSTHTVVVDYQGSSNFAGSTGVFYQHVNAAATTASISSNTNPSVFGQPVTFTAAIAVVSPGTGTPDGQVQFFVDGVASGDPVTLSGGSATSAPITDLSTGDHDVSVGYLGDVAYAPSESATITQTVNRAATATALTSSVNPSVYGQPVTLSADVSAVAPGSGNPTGTLTFTDGSSILGTVSVGPDTGEQGSVTTSALTVGPHAISVSYSGDGNFTSSADATTQTVHRAQSSTIVTSSVNPSASGQAVRFTAVVVPVAPGAGAPSGMVTFTVNGAAIGSPVALADGSATSAAFASLSPGTYDIRASYAGDVHFAASSAALDQGAGQNVTQAQTSLQLTSTPNPAAFAATVSFTAAVSAVAPSTGRPTGVVDFYDGDDLIGASSLVAGSDAGSADATFSSSSLTTGSHAIRAVYLGNFNFTGQTGSVAQAIGLVPTVTGLTASPDPVTYGQSVTLTSTVVANPTSAGAPTGTVTFLDGTTVLGTASLASVQGRQIASLAVPGLHAGAHQVTAVYSGSATFGTSHSVSVLETVQRATPHLVAQPLVTGAPPGYQVGVVADTEVQATLTGNGGTPLAGQTLTFTTTPGYPDGSIITMCTAVTDPSGTAPCDTTSYLVSIAADNGYDVSFAGSADYGPITVHQVVTGN